MEDVLNELEAVLDKDLPLVSNLSNASSIINKIGNTNWCGFYLLKGEYLYLGPFQGDIACTKIKLGKGMCGNSALKDITINVKDVNTFPGHIACSSLSKSEIVIPIHKDNKVIGVLDIDAPIYDRFSKEDETLLENAVKIIEKAL